MRVEPVFPTGKTLADQFADVIGKAVDLPPLAMPRTATRSRSQAAPRLRGGVAASTEVENAATAESRRRAFASSAARGVQHASLTGFGRNATADNWRDVDASVASIYVRPVESLVDSIPRISLLKPGWC